MDFTQTRMEPLLVRYATHHGFEVRFSTELVSAEQVDDGTFLCKVTDQITKLPYQIRTRFLFGADGGRSVVGRSLPFTFLAEPPHGVACNVLLRADLTHLMHSGRVAQLHWIMKPDRRTRFGIAPVMRMVTPWTEWLLVAFSPDVAEDPFRDLTPTSPELLVFLRELVGDDDVGIEVLRIDPWVQRETVAERFQHAGSAFLLGDAAHRHSPAYGLGSNTCLQDAYNLAWKVAFVAKGLAGRALLDTYDTERQPVGAKVVKSAAAGIRLHEKIWAALGLFAETPEEGARQITTLSEPSEEGAAHRALLHDGLEGMRSEAESLGLTGNQWYDSTAVYLDDEPGPRPTLEGDPIRRFLISTYPGTRLPHAWLDLPMQRKEISTQDLAGKASFCLFTGVGGEGWKTAAAGINKATGIPINVYGIGFGLDYHDVYRQWHSRREVDEDGCVLVRPDRFVAWRATKMAEDPEAKLMQVFNKILSREHIELRN
jgi:2-polyprenyl-6-methoxyphenol hydroxylase-like FAD-dependent oxidoreductase